LPTSPSGNISLVLHCHLPFVRNPEYNYFLEENWFYEALFETYVPLLSVFNGLSQEAIPFRLTLSLSPTLLSMCLDPLLQKRAVRYIDQLLALARKEEKRVQSLPAFQPVVHMYVEKLGNYRRRFVEDYHCNILEGFQKFQEAGNLELITCAATHGYLPLLGVREEAVRAQIETALKIHQDQFGQKPAGFWLPECGYQPGLDNLLKEYGIEYFFLETHGILQAAPRPRYGTFAPVVCPSGVLAFGRDMESSKQVWSSKEGYPGDPDYREFYRDVGYDLEEGYLHPYLQPEGIRRFTGLKYHRVTGPTDQKEPYEPAKALKKAEEHAGDFLQKRQKQIEEVSGSMDRKPLIVCMYDAELFGHWWYEGPDFLYFLFKKNHGEGGTLSFLSPSDYLSQNPDNQPSQPVFSSWGLGGYSEFWLNEANDWIYPYLNQACGEMSELAGLFPKASGKKSRSLRQAARELLLAQASDWAFMMKAGHYRDYAEKRLKTHLNRFYRLAEGVRKNKVDEKFLTDIEERDNLFPHVDYRSFQSRESHEESG
jgi:1,4-alpha-glucan branching enzyme